MPLSLQLPQIKLPNTIVYKEQFEQTNNKHIIIDVDFQCVFHLLTNSRLKKNIHILYNSTELMKKLKYKYSHY